MDYLQYEKGRYMSKYKKKPTVLNLVINGLPSIQYGTVLYNGFTYNGRF